MAFAPELVRVVVVVPPLDVRLLVLPVPRLREDHVALADPRPVLHAAGDPAHPRLAVDAAQSHVVAAEVFRHHGEHFVVVGHSEVPTPGFFAHIGSMSVGRISDGRLVCACLVTVVSTRFRGSVSRDEPAAPPSEAFKSRRADGSRMKDMESLVLDQDDEMLSPAVVVATIALLAVFVIGFLVQIVGLVA